MAILSIITVAVNRLWKCLRDIWNYKSLIEL